MLTITLYAALGITVLYLLIRAAVRTWWSDRPRFRINSDTQAAIMRQIQQGE